MALGDASFSAENSRVTPGFIAGAFWLVIDLNISETGESLVLDFGPELVDRSDLYVPVSGGWILADSAGRRVPTAERRLISWRNALQVPDPPAAERQFLHSGGVQRVLVRFSSFDSVHLSVRAFTGSGFFEQTLGFTFLHAFIIGVISLILTYLFVCFFWFKEKIFLLLAVSNLFFLLYLLVMKGFAHTYIWGAFADNVFFPRLSYIFCTIGLFTGSSLLLFTADFSAADKRLRLILKVFFVASILFVLLFALLPEIATLYTVSLIVLVCGSLFLCLFISALIISRRSLSASLLVAWFPFLLYIVFRQSYHMLRLRSGSLMLESFFDNDYYFSYDFCCLFQLIIYTWVIYSKIRTEQQNARLQSERNYFFRTMAHELIAPATLIQQAAGELAASRSQESDSQLLESILSSCRRVLNMSVLVNSLEEQEQHVEEIARKMLPIRPAAICREIIGEYVWYAGMQKKRIVFNCPLPADFVVYVYPLFLEAVIGNLLDNAVKYSDPDTQITVTLELDDETGRLLFSVHNYGLTVSEIERRILFELNYRSDAAKTGACGFGVGLNLVQRIANLYKGGVAVTPDGPSGQPLSQLAGLCADTRSESRSGTSFTVYLCLETASVHPVPAGTELAPANQIDSIPPFSVQTKRTSALLEKPISGAVILVVEDNLAMLQNLYAHFSSYCTVIPAVHGAEALEKMKDGIPSLIISDIVMPVMDGRELYAACKANAAYKDIPFIFFTALHSEEQMVRAFTDGITDYIQKPVDFERLRLKVFSLLDLCSRVRKNATKETLDRMRRFIESAESETGRNPVRAQTTKELREASYEKYKLTDREKEVCEKLYFGKSNRDISLELHISPNTIATHVRSIYDKVGVNRREKLIRVLFDRTDT